MFRKATAAVPSAEDESLPHGALAGVRPISLRYSVASGDKGGLPPEARRAQGGGGDEIRTHDTTLHRITV